MNNNPRFQRASTDFTVAFPVREYIAGRNNESGEPEEITITELPSQTAADCAAKYTHRTGSTADDQPRHHRERHPVDEHQARVQQKHAGALRELARRLKAENERNIDAAVNRLWARLHPQAKPLGQGE